MLSGASLPTASACFPKGCRNDRSAQFERACRFFAKGHAALIFWYFFIKKKVRTRFFAKGPCSLDFFVTTSQPAQTCTAGLLCIKP